MRSPTAPPEAAPGPWDGSDNGSPSGSSPGSPDGSGAPWPAAPAPRSAPSEHRPPTPTSARWAPRLVPVAAGLAVALSSSALSGVLQGHRWFWYVLAAVGVVVVLGVLARLFRLHLAVVVAIQFVGLVLLLTGLFSTDPVFGVLPGPSALGDLWHGLAAAITQIESGIPPVATSPAMLLLVSVGFGVVALGVDATAVAGQGPAVCGLVLLGAYTVPTALAPKALPDWSIAAGAAGYALLLVTEHRRRQARRGIPTARPVRMDVRPLSSARRTLHRVGRVLPTGTGTPLALVLTAVAVLAAIGVGLLATPIGTHGRFAGNGHGSSPATTGQFGLNPFTSLRGQLDNGDPNELLRVSGLPGPLYLRALTLNRYVPQQGWQLPDRYNGVTVDESLPSGLAIPVNNPTATVQIRNVGYLDQWLPLYGLPMGVSGIVPGRWHYDVLSGTAFTDLPTHEPAWTERTGLPNPSVATLEDTPPATDVSPTFLDTSGVDARITAIARAVTKQAHTPFDRTVALNRYFLDPAFGFKYSLKTRPGNSGDALVDFLTSGKTGYCEQFASAMAVMLRTVGVPARVAVGFSAGKDTGTYRSITTGDAHAWVEAYFAGIGWLTFDPTPLDDGRTVTPSYVADAPTVPINVPSSTGAGTPQQGDSGPAPQASTPPGGQGAPVPPADQPGAGAGAGSDQPGPDQSGSGQSGGDRSGSDAAGGQSGDPGDSGDQSAGGQDGSGSAGTGSAGTGDDGTGDDRSGLGREMSIAGLLVALWALLLAALVLLALVALVFTPAAVRGVSRRRRMASAGGGGPDGAVAAWREILAEFRDRGSEPAENDTVRATARQLVRTYRLDGQAIDGMKTVIGAVERGWYAEGHDPGPGSALVSAVTAVRTGLSTRAPLTLPARLWPRSAMPGRRSWRRLTGRVGDRARSLIGG
jgi:TgpA N-terminal domain/Transglutaminase-like superfamily